MSVVQERRCGCCEFRDSACSAARSAIRPSNVEALSEAHDSDSVSTCCSALGRHKSFVDDELSKDSEDAVSMRPLERNGSFSGVSGTRTRCGARACWSVGSAGHSAGRCNKPCPYVRMGRECFGGQNCLMCHLDHTRDDDAIKLALLWLKNNRNVDRAGRTVDAVERASKLSL
eukprot:TRINITY_DN5187_c0_g2_i1.p1 TRINITY_DN5187_c0_g2~~TRINITY_DN5187_c0_g2_i1.p1  ORF type:complete len:173 (+),score=19.55 TRINITY_DN5187_c0_g2_i1:119-637(+)